MKINGSINENLWEYLKIFIFKVVVVVVVVVVVIVVVVKQ